MANSIRHLQAERQDGIDSIEDTNQISGLFRILVVDECDAMVDDLENALWIWPHKLSRVKKVEDAVRLCQHLTPTAILVAVDHDKHVAIRSIPYLRQRFPEIPIVAVVSTQQLAVPRSFYEQGADAVLLRSDAGRPTLHEFLVSLLRRKQLARSGSARRTPALPLPWSQSEGLGAAMCDIKGLIVDANRTLALWLGYADQDALIGKNMQRDLLRDGADWNSFALVARDICQVVCRKANVRSMTDQIMWMHLEVFAAVHDPGYLQVVLIDLTELSILTGSNR